MKVLSVLRPAVVRGCTFRPAISGWSAPCSRSSTADRPSRLLSGGEGTPTAGASARCRAACSASSSVSVSVSSTASACGDK